MIGLLLAAALATASPAATWSPDLGDPVLRDLLKHAEEGSFDVGIAVARLKKAGADVDLARAGQRPHLTAGLEGAVGGGDFSSIHQGAGVPAAATYEVDVFGRLKAAVQAARAEQDAAAADLVMARQLVLAETAKTYVDLRAAQARRASADALLDGARRREALMLRRRDEGDVLGAQLTAARRETGAASAELWAARFAVDAALIRLGELTGQVTPIGEPPADLVPATPDLTNLPSDAVLARPDIQAAKARLDAADARRAEAVAASRPHFMLTAGLGGGEPDLLYLLDVRALAWSIVGGLSHEVFDGGAGKARKHGAAAEARMAELAYRKAVGSAWAQVRLSLGALEQATRAEALARDALADAEHARSQGEVRHRQGDIDGLALVRLEGEEATDRATLAQASAARARAFLDLSLALGGRT